MLNFFFDARVNSVIAPLPHRAYKVYYTYAKWNRVKFLSWHFGSVYIRFRRVVLLSVVMVSRHNTCTHTHTHHTESVRTQCTYIGNAYTHTRGKERENETVLPFSFRVFHFASVFFSFLSSIHLCNNTVAHTCAWWLKTLAPCYSSLQQYLR